jgi:hypothetical protein
VILVLRTVIDHKRCLSFLLRARSPVILIDRVSEEPTEYPPNSGGQLPPGELQFEVARVRPSRPDLHDGFSGSTPGGGFEARAETMRNLFATAWDIHWDHVDEMILGAPKWMDSARFDNQAKPRRVRRPRRADGPSAALHAAATEHE